MLQSEIQKKNEFLQDINNKRKQSQIEFEKKMNIMG
jgi:hypothetical protein